MLKDVEVEYLQNLIKTISECTIIEIPNKGNKKLKLVSKNNNEEFDVDINHNHKIKFSKYTYQERYTKENVLLRLDIDGPPHTNPDGTELGPNHLHVYREGFDERFAIEIPAQFTNTADLVTTLKEFLEYINVHEIPNIRCQEGIKC